MKAEKTIRDLLHPGRRVWLAYPGLVPMSVELISFRRILPAGPVANNEPKSGPEGLRKEHLLQIYTNPGGLRTLAAAHLHLKDPSKQRS